MENRNVNLLPFRELIRGGGKIDLAETILNIFIFVPLGIYGRIIFRQWMFANRLLSICLISLTFEALQYFFRIGAFDITDIITNTLGGMIGIVIYEAIEKIFNDVSRSQKFINIVGTIGTVIIITLLALLKLNMLPVRYQ